MGLRDLVLCVKVSSSLFYTRGVLACSPLIYSNVVSNVRFSLKAEIRLSTVHFVPETDVDIIRESQSLSVILALRF